MRARTIPSVSRPLSRFRLRRWPRLSRGRYRRVLAALLPGLLAVAPAPALAGTITGTVRAQAPAAIAEAEAGGNYGSRRYKFLEQVDYDAMTDFVVSIEDVSAPTPAGQPPPRAQVMQLNGTFVPHVLPVLVGTVVAWPNRDDIFHNVFSVSEKTPFDLGFYKKDQAAKEVVFDKLGRIDVFCSIHTKMNCIVLVLPNPWFARADEHGRFEIPDVPAGTYQLRAWHERLPSRHTTVTVPATGEVRVDFVLGLSELPKR